MALINQAIKTKLKAEEIEKYTSSFVNKIFENREADIVYKYKNKNIFFLIEHQTKIDYSMQYRILEYEIEIMKSAIDIRKVKNKEYKLPLVIPIVLYTGKKKWDAKRYLEESQETLDGVKIIPTSPPTQMPPDIIPVFVQLEMVIVSFPLSMITPTKPPI